MSLEPLLKLVQLNQLKQIYHRLLTLFPQYKWHLTVAALLILAALSLYHPAVLELLAP